MTQFEFKNPYFLYLLIPYAVMVIWYLYRRLYRASSAVAVSSEALFPVHKSIRTRTYRFMPLLRFIAIFCLIVSLARPGKGVHYSSIKNLGIDIMIALDVSGSMRGEDFQPKNRLAVAKQVVKDFVGKRGSDRIGMVVFAGEAYLQCPLTVEHNMIKDIVDEVDFGTVSVDGTAIGDALALSASRMMESKAKSKVILLITDGMNNRGAMDPETAAQTCRDLDIKIYSVGIGREGRVPVSNPQAFFGKSYIMSHFDPEILEKASEMTGGSFIVPPPAVSSGKRSGKSICSRRVKSTLIYIMSFLTAFRYFSSLPWGPSFWK